ncbi:MAG: peptidoglycan bridge formation glycyltransferase FemA/FemB family protein [Lachnospiraceae bacterium]|nr:peptidoglycan bridge formation glycyltransferase FemA/FemB family protein [Lachnospiraceae bacterium]
MIKKGEMTMYGNEAIIYMNQFESFVKQERVIKEDERVNKKEYEAFVEEHCMGSFLQSVDWGAVKEGWISRQVVTRGKDGNINASMQVLIKKIPYLNISYMYAPRGPVCDFADEDGLRELMKEVDKLQKRYHAFAFKTDPCIEEGDRVAIENLKKVGFEYLITKDGYDTIQCRSNYVLDLAGKSCEELYAAFRKKHRYNIRVAERKGVECSFFGIEKVEDFYQLMIETGERDGFKIRSKEYYARLIRKLGNKAKLCMCYYEGMPVSGALIINYGGRMSYLYGASSNNHREVMANYLMHWTIIKHCKELGCSIYDFMGIPYYYDKDHKNYGVYRFKKGFSGRVVNYAGEFEKVYYPLIGRMILKVMNLLGYKL